MHTSAGFIASPAPVYYERLVPAQVAGDPLVLVHGGVHTGACYRCTPDGRPGWAHDFVEQGFEVIIPDWPGSGRSGYLPLEQIDGERIVRGLEALLEEIGRPVTLLTHSMSGPYGWKLLETSSVWIRRLVGVAPGPPGNIQPLPEVISEDDEQVEVQGLAMRWALPKRQSYLMDKQRARAKLVGSSSRFPMHAWDRYLASLQPMAARLIYERQNIGGSQLRVSDTLDLGGMPILVITGTDDTDHPRQVDEAVAHWAARQGARADFIWLGDRGITGNGHMLMLEDNSAEIARTIGNWIRLSGG